MTDSEPASHLPVNLANWESRVPLHEQGYDLDVHRRDPDHLTDVVRFDVPLLGDIAGLDVVHLQCHIGTDTLSLHRLGGRVTGLDFSPAALEVARRLAADCDAPIDYVQAELYDAVEALGSERFDVVYTGIGALCWLPDVAAWARVVAGLLRPGGRLFIREGHPMLWSLDDPREDGLLVVAFPYFEVPGGTLFTEEASYVEHDGTVASPDSISFNHGLGEILTAVTDAGMRLDSLTEHQSVPWNPLGEAMEQIAGGEYRLRERPERLAATYTLCATKRPRDTDPVEPVEVVRDPGPVEVLIRAEVLDGIRDGDVTLAFRRWTRPRVRPGTRLRTAVGLVAIDDVEVIERHAITDEDARRAGSPDAAAVLDWLDRREGEWYRIQLSHAGEDPRIALRQQADLGPEAQAELVGALDRFDSTSRNGPWTRSFLRTIADHPAVLAADLATSLGLERAWFKRHVRKLKELGLTESLPTGYRLSPRGRALLDALSDDQRDGRPDQA